MKFYKCEICGNIVEMIKESGNVMSCCGQNMKELIPCSSDGAVEKHVPVCEMEGRKVCVKVGENEHPMLDAHFIEWIALETTKGVYRIMLHPGDAPKAHFTLCEGEEVVGVYAYCNLHGLWKA